MSSERNETTSDIEALELIRTSNVLNPDATMEKVLRLTQALNRLEVEGASESRGRGDHDWYFISKYFIHKGDFPKN